MLHLAHILLTSLATASVIYLLHLLVIILNTPMNGATRNHFPVLPGHTAFASESY